MVTEQGKKLILQVASKIVRDKGYSGDTWWRHGKGCAMTRILIAAGGKVEKDRGHYVDLTGFDPANPDKVLGCWDYTLELDRLTGICRGEWHKFQDWSTTHGRFSTWFKLRKMARKGKF